MVALKAAEIDGFIARPDPAKPVVLVYGPDAGLVHERAEALVAAAVDDPHDPFCLARIDGDTLADDASRLVEEAHTVPLFGGRRAVWVKAGGRSFVHSVEQVLAAPPGADCRIVIEAGDLKRGAALRSVCEQAKNAAVIACYADRERDLARLIDAELNAAGLSIAADARSQLIALLGGDRTASRSELRKLALFARGRDRVELDDIAAVVSDASLLAIDGILDAAFAGRPAELESQLAKSRAQGVASAAILSAALRHVGQLHRLRTAIERGRPVAEAAGGYSPRLHFSREPLVNAALGAWTAARLAAVMSQLAEAALDARRQSALADTLAQRALLSIAVAARRKT